MLAGCASQRTQQPLPAPSETRAQILRLLPAGTSDRQGWAADIQVAFTAQEIAPTTANLCSVLAVAEQESGLHADPVVPGLAKIARREIDRRASARHIPGFLVDAALWLKSPDGRRYSERLKKVRTERQLSEMFQDFIGIVPLGKRLFGDLNPVHTGGPMQVSVAFAEAHSDGYPYPVKGSIRHEVFTRRGGMFFGVAHLLGYPASYDRALYRFADFNAGHYASRNAAFQHAVTRASGIALALDGDLVKPGAGRSDPPGATELAVRSLAGPLRMSDSAIHRALEQSDSAGFERSELYQRLFALADRVERKPLPRAILPGIDLQSPKITRHLTTAWFAKRVDDRRQRCMARAPAG
ncbi:MAG: DUF1615 domain-containing protein [Rhodanobacter sp.]